VDTVLELRGLSRQFPTHRAVDDLSLQLKRGEFFSLIGPSGCGKTTTLRMIAGLDSPTAGDILLEGKSIVDLKPYQRDISTVFQSYALFPHMTRFRKFWRWLSYLVKSLACPIRFRAVNASASL
jgi:spermidine/putrescine transport system ATP-binding protein